jgi:hypothetical protein
MYAKIAQLVERHLAKVEVAGSNPVFRSGLSALGGFFFPRSSGGIGRHAGLKILWASARAGSSPASSTKPKQLIVSVLAFLFSCILRNFSFHFSPECDSGVYFKLISPYFFKIIKYMLLHIKKEFYLKNISLSI